MHRRADAVADVLADHGEAGVGRHILDGGADVPEAVALDDLVDGGLEGRAVTSMSALRFVVDVADGDRDGRRRRASPR